MGAQNTVGQGPQTETVWQAARRGDLREVKRQIEYGGDNTVGYDAHHHSPLWYGVESGDVDTVRYLVEWVGLDPLEGDREGRTPWDLAHELGQEEILAYFAQRYGCAYEDTYHNPVRRGFFPDPSVVRVGEDYYMVNSTFIYFPCIPVSHSRDLIHWEIIGYAITNPKWARLDGLSGGMGYWAPDISYCDGRFYIAATLRRNNDMEPRRIQMVTSSSCPEGPYDEPVFLEDDGIDPSIFHDDDGRKYMLVNRGARILELSRDCRQIISPGRLLWYGSVRIKPEGPHLLKHQGYYYLFLAEGGTGSGHCITVARSRQLMGPYEPGPYNPILHQWDGDAPIQCCGHGKPIQLKDGRWYMVYLCLRKTEGGYGLLGRETSLDPMAWTADGWPVVNGGRGPSQQQKKPFPGIPGVHGYGKIPLGGYPYWEHQHWLTPRPAKAGGVSLEDGHLYLRGDGEDLCSIACRSVLVHRQPAFAVEAACSLRVPWLEEGQSQGMACYYDEHSYVKYGVARKAGRLGILLQEYVGEAYRSSRFIPLPAGTLGPGEELFLKMEASGMQRSFSCLVGKEWMQLGELADTAYLSSEGLALGKRFTGAMAGVYVEGDFRGEFCSWTFHSCLF